MAKQVPENGSVQASSPIISNCMKLHESAVN